MIFKAEVSSKAHPEYGQATIPFPIPDNQYDSIIELLEATVITDFSDLEQVGKDHSLTINGGSMPMEEFKQIDGLSVALDLIQSGGGVVTPYGVVYDNSMKLERFYDGRHLPLYCYKPATMVIGVKSGPEGTATGYLYLPAPDQQIQRSLERAGIGDQGFQMEVITDDLPPQVSALVSPTRDNIDDLTMLAGFAKLTEQFGPETAAQVCELSLNRCVLYPYELERAAEEIQKGSGPDTISELMLAGELEAPDPVFPKLREVLRGGPQNPNFEMIL